MKSNAKSCVKVIIKEKVEYEINLEELNMSIS